MKTQNRHPLSYRIAGNEELKPLRQLSIAAWSQYKDQLTSEHWESLFSTLVNKDTCIDLLFASTCFVCTCNRDRIVGAAFFVPSGNPTPIYKNDWCYIRFVSVHPQFLGRGIGEHLTKMCIEYAREAGEAIIALHTSEMMVKAIHIYEKMGFRKYKEIAPRLGKRYWLYTLSI